MWTDWLAAGRAAFEVFGVALKLGLTSFGGPIAHLGYFRQEYVTRRQWLSEAEFADVVALAQALPGPTSSQVGMALGHRRAGSLGAFAAWLGFTLPSALLLTLAAWASTVPAGPWWHGVVRGLGLVALAVVSQAVWSMGRTLIRGVWHAALAVAALVPLALAPWPWVPPLVLFAAAIVGLALGSRAIESPPDAKPHRGLAALLAFFGLLLLLPLLRWGGPLFELADTFYRAGALVFGGGHVVLPLLQNELVGPGRLRLEDFLTGYGWAQAVPGPLFSVAAYYGFLVCGLPGALVALVAMFLPGFLLVLGVLPLWARWRTGRLRSALEGVNAAVVGILAWAWYQPVLTGSVHSWTDAAVAGGLVALLFAKLPSWAVVVVGVLVGLALGVAGL